MKKIILISIVTIAFFIFSAFSPISNSYGLTTVVVNVSEANNKVTCQDFNGNLWQFEGTEDWCVNDIATFVMNDKGTDKIEDDEIINIRYNGYFEGWLFDNE